MIVSCLVVDSAHAQVALKTNFLYDATTTPNLGVEVGLSRKSTFQVVYGLNPWKFNTVEHGERKLNHWLVMPEYRWWTCTKFNGHFFGVHAMGGQFNAANVDFPFMPGVFFGGADLIKGLKDYSYDGKYLGGGITYGYQWILNRHFNLEAEIGVGVDHIWYNKYECGDCGPKLAIGQTNYAGVTKVGISLLYLF